MKLQYIGTSIFYDVDVMAILPNVIQVTGSRLIMKESGFILIDDEDNEYDYSDYSTLYRTVDGGFQYSNDGSIWIEPTKSITVKITWNDSEDHDKVRPSSVAVEVFDNRASIGTVTLSLNNNWTKVYENVPESHDYSVNPPEVEHYTSTVRDTYIDYNYIVEPPEPEPGPEPEPNNIEI